MSMLKKFWSDEAGLESLEYGVIAAVILVALVTAYALLRNKVNSSLTNLTNAVP